MNTKELVKKYYPLIPLFIALLVYLLAFLITGIEGCNDPIIINNDTLKSPNPEVACQIKTGIYSAILIAWNIILAIVLIVIKLIAIFIDRKKKTND